MDKAEFYCSKKIFHIIKAVTSKNKVNVYCLKNIHLFGTENNHSLHENVYINYYYCHIFRYKKYQKISSYYHGKNF